MDQEKTALQGCELCKYSIGVEPEPDSEPGRGYRVMGVGVSVHGAGRPSVGEAHSLVSLSTQKTVDICVAVHFHHFLFNRTDEILLLLLTTYEYYRVSVFVSPLPRVVLVCRMPAATAVSCSSCLISITEQGTT